MVKARQHSSPERSRTKKKPHLGATSFFILTLYQQHNQSQPYQSFSHPWIVACFLECNAGASGSTKMHAHHLKCPHVGDFGCGCTKQEWCWGGVLQGKRGHQGVHQGARLSIRVLTRGEWEHARFLVVRCRNTLKNAENCCRVDVFYYLSYKNHCQQWE